MKILTYKDYLIKEDYASWQKVENDWYEEIDISEVQDYAYANCQEALKYIKAGSVLYKGSRFINGEAYTFDTRTRYRSSAYNDDYGDLNYYTILIDNLPNWKKFPPRSRSIICASNYDWASEFEGQNGANYVILPHDNDSIGICPSDDIWNSFQDIELTTLNPFIHWVANEILGIELDDDPLYEDLVNVISKFPKTKKAFNDADLQDYYDYVTIVELYFKFTKQKKLGINSWLEFFAYLLDPDRNRFIVGSYKFAYTTAGLLKNNIGPTTSREVWVHGPVLMVRFDVALKMFGNR